jgi:2-oxoacid:acceptor oxidoreductase gamma subunit (pyruvate/2-ketoisovalerate family)
MIEITFKGRGGQGAVVASEILGKSFFMEGKYPQSFSIFGNERRGAPVFGFLRVDDKPILLKCQIRHPDHMIILDLSLTDEQEICRELKPGGLLLINSHRAIDSFKNLRRFKIGLINAGPIARQAGLGATFNMAMLGAYIRLTDLVRLETLIDTVRTMVPAKVEQNVESIKKAYEQVKVFAAEG